MLDIISKTTSQALQEISIIRNIILTPDIIYTCPVGKRARCKGRVVCEDRGAAAVARFLANAVSLFEWNSNANFAGVSSHPAYLSRPFDMTTLTDEPALFDLVLEAGQNIMVNQNAGTNAQFKIDIKIRELPI